MFSNGNYKYWYRYNGDGETKIIYYFDNKGHWCKFRSTKEGNFVKWNDPCNITKDTWKLFLDTLELGGYPNYFLDSIDSNHFILKYKVSLPDKWVRDTFYAAPDSIIPIEYRRKLKVRIKGNWNSTFNTIEYDAYLE